MKLAFLRTLSFWKFATPRLSSTQSDQLIQELKSKWRPLDIYGRVYIGSEGINGQISVPTRNLIALQRSIRRNEFLQDIPLNLETKIHYNLPLNEFFPHLTIKHRDQIITHSPSYIKDEKNKEFISSLDFTNAGNEIDPEEWHNKLSFTEDQSGNTLILDCRNEYEQSIGSFLSSEPLQVSSYSKSFEYLDELQPKLKQKDEILIYCTGGVRCVKIGAYLKQKLNIENVGMLKGGITAYSKYINKNKLQSKFKGTNFVFDSRIGVKIENEPIGTCMYCNVKTHVQQNCSNPCCNKLIIICESCKEKNQNSCSEECKDYHFLDQIRQKQIRQKCAQVFASLPNYDERKDRFPVYKNLLKEFQQTRSYSTMKKSELNEKIDFVEFNHHDSIIKREKYKIDEYCSSYSSPLPKILFSIEESTKEKFPKTWGNICGYDVAQFLSFLVKSRNCKKILEIGCFTGYSTIALASAFNESTNSIIDTCDISEECISITNSNVNEFFKTTTHENCKINVYNKSGLDLLNDLKLSSNFKPYDFIFIDANKSQYKDYYSFIIDNDLLDRNGILVFDNILFKSLVLPDSSLLDDVPKRLLSIGKKLHAFTQFVHEDARTTQQIVQIRDGLLLVSRVN